jgi:hypothetical protein
MNYQQYRELCREASASLALPDHESLATEGFLDLNGVRIALFFDEELITDRIFCYVDLGPVEEGERDRIFEKLLMLNLLSGTKTSGVYSLDPGSGNAIFCVHLMEPDRLQGNHLADLLHCYAERAINFRNIVKNPPDDLSFIDTAREIFDLDDICSQSELV